ncbi:hypothetical protein OsI_26707 [Oryza sativa Indica Group]|jgi:hypothetical protein|uniref:Uncharacterized protein n=2 Tax=Oryza sativa TaxID=4530 RepID=Q84RX4_ORYSJ|nr:hypothetical protein OsI_26707 [Oryza sativa Indica Group]BAC65900.1 hypothetical protein [Oryza sativa Japonica Group]
MNQIEDVDAHQDPLSCSARQMEIAAPPLFSSETAQRAEETRREIFFYAREGEDTRGCVGRAAEQRRQTAGDGEAPRDDGRGDASEGRGEDARRRRGGAASGATGLGLGSPEPAP